ncbi:uncharacterized protein DUF4833 [Mucilaginibacter gracilis]|uniref:Uncharacterized protein DUF4833 n=1 Tax=Mucilaginibacter gracilis TaxID=423350 RepID=A0A495J3R0_9SPHI|nr:DUF4833 domain-containing protein [Mucilaginibacter gracilis]RKR83008.1 uncharacterized protein DUF4833 [Mucilaginibacter gracilis]
MNIAPALLLNFALLFHLCLPSDRLVRVSKLTDIDTTSRKAKVINFPVPNVAKLFYVQRDPNTNTIIYDINLNGKGEPDPANPVHVYWIKYNEKGQKEELNFIQRKFAYGLVTKPLDNGKFDIRFVSYKKYPLYLMKAETDNKYHIFATIAKKQAILNRIFIKIEGGTFWLPNVVYVEVKGTDPATGKEIVERFKP